MLIRCMVSSAGEWTMGLYRIQRRGKIARRGENEVDGKEKRP